MIIVRAFVAVVLLAGVKRLWDQWLGDTRCSPRDTSTPPPLEVLSAFREGRMHFAERVHYTAMAADLIARVNLAVAGWAESWLQRTETWHGTALDEPKRVEAAAVLDELATHLARRRGVGGHADDRPGCTPTKRRRSR